MTMSCFRVSCSSHSKEHGGGQETVQNNITIAQGSNEGLLLFSIAADTLDSIDLTLLKVLLEMVSKIRRLQICPAKYLII